VIGYKKENEHVEEIRDLVSYVSPQDLKAYGLIPEIIGRLPVLAHLEPLSREVLLSILIEPKNALIKQYQKLFRYEGIELSFEQDALDYIVDKAMEYNLGARGLRSICEAVIVDAMYELPSEESIKEFKISREYAEVRISKSKISKLRAA